MNFNETAKQKKKRKKKVENPKLVFFLCVFRASQNVKKSFPPPVTTLAEKERERDKPPRSISKTKEDAT